ncbi:TraM recognition domain-containing protein [Halogeometricum borinquense]|uniref:TraM recognition domain-containing protein n=1 Tax=Halogeometricum borinquense TaxID=60847 RepID=A0A6C0UJK3_9EURY|nr:type IV secretion system DNA-binding domain-containing protein [Halogeometricum borinquense]QIB75397.1 TraM recognition domain-containing protein [Halogeometricum borinquense]
MNAEEAQQLIQNADAFNETFIGAHQSHFGAEQNVGIKDQNRLKHVLSIGPTGVGKTQVKIHAALQDAIKGRGFCFINPKGGAIDQILAKLPENRIDDVIYINPAADHVTSVNVLAPEGTADMDEDEIDHHREIIVSDLLDLFRRQNGGELGVLWGRVLEDLLRAHIDLNIYEDESNTMIDVYNAATDGEALTELIDRTRDVITRRQLVSMKEDLSDKELEPLRRRLKDFLRPTVRRVVGAEQSGIDFREAMDNNQIILVDIQKSRVGATVSQIIGSIIATKVWAAAQSRITLASSDRDPFMFYMDEAQDFSGEDSSLKDILSQAREYGLGCWLSTQYLNNLESRELRRAVRNNCRTKIVFDPADSEDLSKINRMLRGLDKDKLTRLADYRCAVQQPGKGQQQDAVIVDTYPPWPGDRDESEITSIKHGASRPTQTVPDTAIRAGTKVGRGMNAGEEAHTELLAAAKEYFEDQYGWTVQLLYQDTAESKPDGTIVAGDEIKHLEAECGTLSKPTKVLRNVERAHEQGRGVVFVTAADDAQKLSNILLDPVNRRGDGDGEDDDGTYAYYRDSSGRFSDLEVVTETPFKIYAVSESGSVYPYGTDREATCPMLGDYTEAELEAFCLHRDEDGYCEKLGEPCVIM